MKKERNGKGRRQKRKEKTKQTRTTWPSASSLVRTGNSAILVTLSQSSLHFVHDEFDSKLRQEGTCGPGDSEVKEAGQRNEAQSTDMQDQPFFW